MRRLAFASVLFALPLTACTSPESDEAAVDDEDWRADGKSDEAAVPLRYRSYDLLFTNPLCREYTYPTPVETADGSTTLRAKPKNVYCSSADAAASAARETSPQHKLLTWLEPLGADDEVFLAFLSFSNRVVGDRLCELAQAGTKITFVLDAPSEQSNRLAGCGAEILLRGHAGSIGYAHNKLILINPHGDSEFMQMTVSSGNMSSGIVTHHENWHFIDVARDSYFGQNHVCLMEAQVSEEASSGRAAYKASLDACRANIEAPEETDVKSFFIPHSEDRKRAARYLLGAVDEATAIDLGAHRFGHSDLVRRLEARLQSGAVTVRMVADDDLYWLDPEVGEPSQPGSNDDFEAKNVRKLMDASENFEIRYFETNHGQHLLHHNKYLVYRNASGAPYAVLAGAANLTKTGFNDNFENIYFFKVPAVLDGFNTQIARVWDGQKATPDEQDPPIATPRHLMPVEDIAGQ